MKGAMARLTDKGKGEGASIEPRTLKIIEIIFIVAIVIILLVACALANFQYAEETNKPHNLKVVIDYGKPWQGSYTLSTGSSASIQGDGYSLYTCILYKNDIIVVNAQKQDDSQDMLSISIFDGEKLVKSGSTTAEYGIAMISYTVN